MYLLAAVLVTYGSAAAIGEWGGSLPGLVRWSWLTFVLLACGWASIHEGYERFWERALGLASVSLFYISYPLLWEQYQAAMPETSAGGFAHWPELFLVANVLLPLIFVTIGPLLPVVATGSDDNGE